VLFTPKLITLHPIHMILLCNSGRLAVSSPYCAQSVLRLLDLPPQSVLTGAARITQFAQKAEGCKFVKQSSQLLLPSLAYSVLKGFVKAHTESSRLNAIIMKHV